DDVFGDVLDMLAVRADEMVVVFRVARDVRGDVPLALEPARHPVLDLLLQRAVHGRAADRRMRRADPLVELLSGQSALRRGEHLRDENALLRTAATTRSETRRDRRGGHAGQHRTAGVFDTHYHLASVPNESHDGGHHKCVAERMAVSL